MALNEKKARDIMKKASGCELVEASFTAVPHGFIALLAGREELICLTDGACGFADRLECLRDEYKYGVRLRTAALNEKNSHTLRFFVKWTAPRAVGRNMSSIGLDDMFGGAALPVWAEVFAGAEIKVVVHSNGKIDGRMAGALGEQAWQVLAAGLKSGYGSEYSYASGESEIMDALLAGYTGIVLDGRVKTDENVHLLGEAEIRERFAALPDTLRSPLREHYLGAIVRAGGMTLKYTEEKLAELTLRYKDAIAWLQYIYHAYFKSAPWPVDFIVRADGALNEEGHYFLANELLQGKVAVTAMEISVGEDAARHGAIAKALGHKIRLCVQDNQVKVREWIDNGGCLLDIRPAGQMAARALAVLAQADDPLLARLFPGMPAEAFTRQPPDENILAAAGTSSGVIAGALAKYKDAYKGALQKLACEQKALWTPAKY